MTDPTHTSATTPTPYLEKDATRGATTAIFPGTFDPFTIGHADIVSRSLALFDHIVIAIGYNADKTPATTVEERRSRIVHFYASESRVSVVTYNDLTVSLARRQNARFVIRGIRSVKDFEYERDIATTNSELDGLETVFILPRPQYAHISSSLVRELQSHGQDVSRYLP